MADIPLNMLEFFFCFLSIYVNVNLFSYNFVQKNLISFADRFEATRKIREMENNVNIRIQRGEFSIEAFGNILTWHVPILAMTADVIQATHEECTKCGMDGYVSKPFEAEQLYREVSRFLKSASNGNL